MKILILFFMIFSFYVFGITESDQKFFDNFSYIKVEKPVMNESNYSFVICTDTHYGSNTENSFFQNLESKNFGCDFCIILGDITQGSEANQWLLYLSDIKNLSIPVIAIVGNHDVVSSRWQRFMALCNRTDFYFEIGNILYLFIDSSSNAYGDLQLRWINNVLSKTTCTQKIIFTHCLNGTAGTELNTICQTYNIDLVIKGAMHQMLDEYTNGIHYITVNSLNTTLSSDGNDDNCYLVVNVVNDVIVNYSWYGK
jgi:predicted phosphodiesterase